MTNENEIIIPGTQVNTTGERFVRYNQQDVETFYGRFDNEFDRIKELNCIKLDPRFCGYYLYDVEAHDGAPARYMLVSDYLINKDKWFAKTVKEYHEIV